MIDRSCFKKVIQLVLGLVLLVGFVQFGGFTVYASSFSDYPIAHGSTVVANYDEASKTLTISGSGKVHYPSWVGMAQKINPTYFSDGQNGWDYDVSEDNMKIVFSGGPKAIQLCGSGSKGGLFEHFSGQIHFYNSVDLDPAATDLSYMFAFATQFNEPVPWNTINVTTMKAMFYGAESFNQPVEFNTSNVTDMSQMFVFASSFNQAVDFDTSNVTNMMAMFDGASSFNQPVRFDTANVCFMNAMFHGATSFNQPVSFDISSARNVSYMFESTDVRTVILNNISTNSGVEAIGIFDNVDHLEQIEFSYLKNVSIDGFGGSYNLSEITNEGANQFLLSAYDPYDFIDNAECRVVLQSSLERPFSNLSFNSIPPETFKGMPLKPDVEIHYYSSTLQRDVDYVLQYKDNAAPGTATVVITGMGDYYGQMEKTFTINDYESPNLSNNGSVYAHYNSANDELVISGYGEISRTKWKNMARDFSSQNYQDESNGWVGVEPFDIRFSTNSKIKLPTDSKALFDQFDGNVDFDDCVDTSSVTDMRYMFYRARNFDNPVNFDTYNVTDMTSMFVGTNSFNQTVSFDISAARDISYMFQQSVVEKVILKNDDDNQNVTAIGAFDSYPYYLRQLQFSGLTGAHISGFYANYKVIPGSGPTVHRGSHDGYDFSANVAYNVVLEDEATDDISSASISGPYDTAVTGYSIRPDDEISVESDYGYGLDKDTDYVLIYRDNVAAGTAKVFVRGIGYYYGEEEVTFAIGKPLSNDGNVIYSYDAAAGKLTISGHGQIDRDKWKAMAQSFNADNYPSDSDGWLGTEDFDIYFSADDAGQIKLPVNSMSLFDQFNGDIDFNDSVDTSAVTDMTYMFYQTTGLNQALTLDIGSVSTIKEMFVESTIKRLVLNNSSSHQNVDATDAFLDCDNLEYLEFSGLANAGINTFAGDYYVKANGGTPIAKQADEGYVFTDNLYHKVYLQSTAPLIAPTVSLSKAGSAIKVAWPAVAGATGYQVFRADAAAGPYTLFKTTTGLSYTNSGALVPGMPYFYKVRAYKNDGGNYTFSAFSTVKGIYAPGALAKPAAPSLTLDENAGGIRLNWNDQPRITGYQIFRGVSTDKPFSYLKTTSGLAQVYTNLSGLNPGRPYYYKIRAYRTADGVTKYGNFSTIKGLFAGTNEPALNAVNFNLGDNNAVSVPNVRVTWTGVSGADGYCVYRWDSVHKNWIGLKATGPNARVYTNINGVVSGKTFFYGMRPLHISGGTTYYGNIGQAKGYKVP